MKPAFEFQSEFLKVLKVGNAEARLTETREVAQRIAKERVELVGNMDHVAIFSDPPRHVSGPIRALGYKPASDNRCYLSPVDHHELALFVSGLPAGSPLRAQGWFDYIAAVYAIDDASYDHVIEQGQGNPFIHHMTMGIAPLPRGSSEDDLHYALRVIPYVVDVRAHIEQALGEEPGNLIIALPQAVFADSELRKRLPELTRGLDGKACGVEAMQGGGFLLQFFVLAAGRIEVALRYGTSQAFNPASVEKISTDEISVRRELLEQAMVGSTR
jgi:hypothetical protein